MGFVDNKKSEYFKKQNFMLLKIKFIYLMLISEFSKKINSAEKLKSSINNNDLVFE